MSELNSTKTKATNPESTETGRHTKSKTNKLSLPTFDFRQVHQNNSVVRSVTIMMVLPILALIVAFAHPGAFNTTTIGMFVIGEILMTIPS